MKNEHEDGYMEI